MIYFNVNIRNPWTCRFENVKNWAGQITKNKWWEIEILKADNLFRFEFQYTVRQDHAGISIELGLLFWEVHANVHDSRHWDYVNGRWEVYGQSD
jgi:hypothetical protein